MLELKENKNLHQSNQRGSDSQGKVSKALEQNYISSSFSNVSFSSKNMPSYISCIDVRMILQKSFSHIFSSFVARTM